MESNPVEPESPPSFIDERPTRPWHHVPGDWRRPSSPERFDLYWDDVNRFGMAHPRAQDAWQTLIYYETDGDPYYTHSPPESTTPDGNEDITALLLLSPFFLSAQCFSATVDLSSPPGTRADVHPPPQFA